MRLSYDECLLMAIADIRRPPVVNRYNGNDGQESVESRYQLPQMKRARDEQDLR